MRMPPPRRMDGVTGAARVRAVPVMDLVRDDEKERTKIIFKNRLTMGMYLCYFLTNQKTFDVEVKPQSAPTESGRWWKSRGERRGKWSTEGEGKDRGHRPSI